MFKKIISFFFHNVGDEPKQKDNQENVGYIESVPQSEQVNVNVNLAMPDFLKDDEVVEEVIKEARSESLLDNKYLVKMFSECADLLEELDSISPRFKSEDSKVLIEMINERLRTAMYLSGGKPIDKDENYDSIRHVCPSDLLAKEGSKILEICEPGVSIDERVFVKAKVKL